jgi:uncharacterized protein
MPYAKVSELPAAVRGALPAAAQKIWMAAHNAAMKQYNGSEQKAAAVAWAAVKNKYKKVKGQWVAIDANDNEIGMVRATAPEDVQDLTIAEQDAYVAAYNKYLEEHPDANCDEIDRAAREAAGIPPPDPSETDDSFVDVEITEVQPLDAAAEVRITPDGYMVATPRVARTGIQVYKGYEVGRDDMEDVRIYRPPDEVFNKKAMSTLAWRPITLDHPYESVNSKNWKEHSVGQSSGEVARDGEFIRVPLSLMDSAAIDAVQQGKAQLSVGYGARLLWDGGTTPDGERYDAVQTRIRANHIAIVSAARGGSRLKIGDGDSCEDGHDEIIDRQFTTAQRKTAAAKGQAMPHGGYPIKSEKDLRNAIQAVGRAKNRAATIAHIKKRARALGLTKLLPENWDGSGNSLDSSRRNRHMKTVLIDGVTIELEDKDSQILERHLKTLGDSIAELKTQLVALQSSVAESKKQSDVKDGEIAALKKQVADGQMTPVKLDQLVRDRLEVVERARRVLGDRATADGKTDSQIKRDVVCELMGAQAAKDMSDDAITGAFYALTAKGGNSSRGLSDLAGSFSRGSEYAHNAMDASEVAYGKRNRNLSDAWKTPARATREVR